MTLLTCRCVSDASVQANFWQWRDLLRRPHIGPNQAAQLAGQIGSHGSFIWSTQLPSTGEFPAVIDATQPALLVAPEKQRGATMWTIFAEELDPAVAVTERDEVLAQQPDAHRRAIGLGDLAHQESRDPIAPHRLAHRRPGSATRFPHVRAW